MSEAQSYQAGNIDKDRVVYLASDFDNVTRLFLDAAERCIASERREKELQQLLTAADERIDELTKPRGEQMACMPVDRSYDVRAKMIIAFNEAKKTGGDLDDALDAAYKSALRYSPCPPTAEQPKPAATTIDYGSLDAVQRLAVCRGDVVSESGSTCNEIREEVGQPINRPCKACGGGACIDR